MSTLKCENKGYAAKQRPKLKEEEQLTDKI